MLLAVDVGNTQTVLGLFDGEELVEHWRVATEAERTGDEIATLDLLDAHLRRLVAAFHRAQDPDQHDREHDSAADTPFGLLGHLMFSVYLSGRPTALSSAANALW